MADAEPNPTRPLSELGDKVGEAHDRGVSVVKVAELVSDDAGELPSVQQTEESVGEGKRWVLLPADDEGIGLPAGEVVHIRASTQPSASCEHIDGLVQSKRHRAWQQVVPGTSTAPWVGTLGRRTPTTATAVNAEQQTHRPGEQSRDGS